MNGGDRHVLQTKRLIQQAQQRHAAVGGAGGIGHQTLFAGQRVLVDAVHDGGVDIGVAGHRLRKQYAGSPGIKKALGVGAGVVDAGAFQHQVNAQRGPVDPFRGGTAEHFHAVAIDMQAVAFDPYLAGEPAMGGVEARQIFEAGHIGQVIECNNFKPGSGPSLKQRTQDATTNPAVAVECNFVRTRLRHGVLELSGDANAIASKAAPAE